jgi:hypothetical protein
MCFEGYVTWLDTPGLTPMNGGPYIAGDAWSCLGFAVAGRWQNDVAVAFTRQAMALDASKPWLVAGF